MTEYMKARTISSADLRRCPHFILTVEHYREDGTCRCDDPDSLEMAKAGYTWRDGRWRAVGAATATEG